MGDFANPSTQRMMAGSLALFVVFLAAWEWGPALTGIPPFIIPPASQVWNSFLRMLANDQLMYHTAITAFQDEAIYIRKLNQC